MKIFRQIGRQTDRQREMYPSTKQLTVLQFVHLLVQTMDLSIQVDVFRLEIVDLVGLFLDDGALVAVFTGQLVDFSSQVAVL